MDAIKRNIYKTREKANIGEQCFAVFGLFGSCCGQLTELCAVTS